MPKVITLAQFCRCEVCGLPKTVKQIRQWNDHSVCIHCIQTLTEEDHL